MADNTNLLGLLSFSHVTSGRNQIRLRGKGGVGFFISYPQQNGFNTIARLI